MTHCGVVAGLLTAGTLLCTACATDAPEMPVPELTTPAVEPEPTEPDVPGTFTNLQVLPEDIGRNALKETMKRISRSLGKKCDYCHRTDIEDFASDEIPEKVAARQMMRMVEVLDRDHFTWEDAPEPTCFMCHRGEVEPRLHWDTPP